MTKCGLANNEPLDPWRCTMDDGHVGPCLIEPPPKHEMEFDYDVGQDCHGAICSCTWTCWVGGGMQHTLDAKVAEHMEQVATT